MKQSATTSGRLGTLMQFAQNGDASSYALLLKEVTPLLRHVIRRRRAFLSAEDIEDLVQDILLSLHAVRATYDPGRPFLPWLTAIAHNRMVDSARRYGRRMAREVQVEDWDVTFSSGAANMDAEGYRDPEALRQAIEELPRGQREAVEMLKLREMSLKEAAAASGTSVGALKVSVHRAVGALRKKLKNE
jgi:RNA polymerase sigma factor (sigma-70 family)